MYEISCIGPGRAMVTYDTGKIHDNVTYVEYLFEVHRAEHCNIQGD